MGLTLDELVEHCTEQTSCSFCTAKSDCKTFKRILGETAEPWALNKLQEAFKNAEKDRYRGGKYRGINLRCEHCGRIFDVPYRHYEPLRDSEGCWDSEDWDECPYCHKIITTEWLNKLKEEMK